MNSNAANTIAVKRIQDDRQFGELRDTWNRLLSKSASDSFFLRWEWLWHWWKTYKEAEWELCILLVLKSNELIGIAPLYVIPKSWKKLFTVRRLLFLGTKEGSVISEYMDFIYKKEFGETIVYAILDFITEKNICDDISLHKMESNSLSIRLLEHLSQKLKIFYGASEKTECPYITLPPQYEDFLNEISSSLRYKIRHNQRRLIQNDISFRKTSAITELGNDFQELVRLHQLRWKSQGMPGSFNGGKFTSFQKSVMAEMIQNRHIELWFMSLAGRNIAALYNINYRNKIFFYQAGLDVSFDKKIAPGVLLHNHCIQDAIKSGLHEYDFLMAGNTDAYKKQWTKQCRYVCDIYMARPGLMKYLKYTEGIAKFAYNQMPNFVKRPLRTLLAWN